MNQQKWREKAYNEWVGRTTGSRLNLDQARGADARRKADAAARARWQEMLPKPRSFSPPVAHDVPVHRSHAPAAMGPAEGLGGPRRARTSKSPASSASRVLALVGALVGYGYAVATNVEVPWLFALGGGLAGAFALDVMAFVFKVVKVVVLALVTLAGVGVALYILAKLMGA